MNNKKINLTKKLLVGGSIALALLTPTIMSAEKLPTNEIQTTNLSGETKTPLPITLELNFGTSKSVNQTFDVAGVHYLDYDNTIYHSDLSINVTSDFRPGEGFRVPQVSVYDETRGKAIGSFDEVCIVPNEIVKRGSEGVKIYLSTMQRNLGSGYDNLFYTQINNGSEGVYYALVGDYYKDNNELFNPILIHVTWDDSFSNDNKMTETSLYYDEFDNDYINLNYKQKKLGKKTWGTSDELGSSININRWITAGQISLPNKYGLYETYRLSIDSHYDSYALTSKFNTITHDANFASLNLSDEAVDSFVDRNIPSYSNNSIYWEFPRTKLTKVIKIEDEEFTNAWFNGETISSDITNEIIEWETTNQGYYNSQLRHASVKTSINGIYEERGSVYLTERIIFNKPSSSADAASISETRAELKEIASLIRGSNFKAFVNTADTLLISDGYDYDKNSYESYMSYAYNFLHFESKPGFVSSSELTLIIFSIVSLIGLGIVIAFLIKSQAKEENEIEIIGAGGDK